MSVWNRNRARNGTSCDVVVEQLEKKSEDCCLGDNLK